MCQMLATLCVVLSLALFALGGFDPTGGFRLGTMSIAGPLAILGSVLDTVAISHDVNDTSCEELMWHVKSCLLHIFTAPARARRFASSIVTLRGYKVGKCPCTQPTSSHMISHYLPASFHTAEKERDIKKQI
jgi:hypothetical protein